MQKSCLNHTLTTSLCEHEKFKNKWKEFFPFPLQALWYLEMLSMLKEDKLTLEFKQTKFSLELLQADSQ